jgi:hypothetical protein
MASGDNAVANSTKRWRKLENEIVVYVLLCFYRVVDGTEINRILRSMLCFATVEYLTFDKPAGCRKFRLSRRIT